MIASPAAAAPDFTPRVRDRRMGFADVLALLARTLDTRNDPSVMRAAFEDSLRRLVPARSI